jgi:hypothetical protein
LRDMVLHQPGGDLGSRERCRDVALENLAAAIVEELLERDYFEGRPPRGRIR